MIAPKPKTVELAELVNLELHKPRSDALALKRLERDALALRKSQDSGIRGDALALLGVIEGLRFNFDGMRQYFEQALAATGYSPHVYVNYASILGSLGRPVEALAMVERALEKTPDDIEALRLALKLATDAFDVGKADDFARRLRNLDALNDDPQIRRALQCVDWQKILLGAPRVTRNAVLERYIAARSIASKHRVRVPEERTSTSNRGILVEWTVDCDDEEVAEMNFETASVLAQLRPDPSELLIAFGFTSTGASVAYSQ